MSKDNCIEIIARSPVFVTMAEEAARMITETGAKNFLTISMWHPKIGKLDVIIQKANGETVAEQLGRLKRTLLELAQTAKTINDMNHMGATIPDGMWASLYQLQNEAFSLTSKEAS
ncbi:MAG: hypothetical protein JEZ11_03800 [Desulfobacterales bacterium]|nr:hypothetical protein [Desulfobacterales bacterium]